MKMKTKTKQQARHIQSHCHNNGKSDSNNVYSLHNWTKAGWLSVHIKLLKNYNIWRLHLTFCEMKQQAMQVQSKAMQSVRRLFLPLRIGLYACSARYKVTGFTKEWCKEYKERNKTYDVLFHISRGVTVLNALATFECIH